MERESLKAYQTYHTKHRQKLEHCRIIKSAEDDSIIVAACQLQVEGDPGDLTFPADMRHKLQPAEVYVEWIACHPDHTGKGLGSKLLKWAESYAKETVNARMLTLNVMQGNGGAVRLYERKGFVVKPDPHAGGACEDLLSKCFVFCCMGCRYCTVLYMEKDLMETTGEATPGTTNPPPTQEGMER